MESGGELGSRWDAVIPILCLSLIKIYFLCVSSESGREAANCGRREVSATWMPPAAADLQPLMIRVAAKILIFTPPTQMLDIIIPPAGHPQSLQPPLPDKKYQKNDMETCPLQDYFVILHRQRG